MAPIQNDPSPPGIPAGAVDIDRERRGSRRLLIGSSLAGVAGALLGRRAEASRDHHGGPLGAATISFGAWILPLDRRLNESPITANHHGLCPDQVTIKSGGCVNFIIAGVHQILVYDDGTLPGDINTALTIAPVGPPPPGVLINDVNRLIYRGPDPTLVPRERVEVVHFQQPGTYLVICAIPRHFQDGMFGFVKVLP